MHVNKNYISLLLSLLYLPLYGDGVMPPAYLSFDSSQHEGTILDISFDLNKTIMASDFAQGKDLEETCNGILAEFTYALWDGKQKQSYYEYITDRIAQDHPTLELSGKEVKKLRAEQLRDFPAYLKQHWPDKFIQYEQELAAMKAKVGDNPTALFPSFYKAIAWLEEHFPGRYVIRLRTFGKDLPTTIESIHAHTPIKITEQGAFKNGQLIIGGQPTPLQEFFTKPDLHHCAIQDDFNYWDSHKSQACGGKVFILNRDRMCMFIDDNAGDKRKPIVNPIEISKGQRDIVLSGCAHKLERKKDADISDSQELNQEERELNKKIAEDKKILTAALMKTGNIVSSNPKKAMLKDEYFIKKICKALANHVENSAKKTSN